MLQCVMFCFSQKKKFFKGALFLGQEEPGCWGKPKGCWGNYPTTMYVKNALEQGRPLGGGEIAFRGSF